MTGHRTGIASGPPTRGHRTQSSTQPSEIEPIAGSPIVSLQAGMPKSPPAGFAPRACEVKKSRASSCPPTPVSTEKQSKAKARVPLLEPPRNYIEWLDILPLIPKGFCVQPNDTSERCLEVGQVGFRGQFCCLLMVSALGIRTASRHQPDSPGVACKRQRCVPRRRKNVAKVLVESNV